MGYTDEDLAKHKYVQFEGLDIDPSGVPYGSSIATEKAMDLNHCVMVAYEMNGRCILILAIINFKKNWIAGIFEL